MTLHPLHLFVGAAIGFLLGTFSELGELGKVTRAADPPISAAASGRDRFLSVRAWRGTFTMETPSQGGSGEDDRGNQNSWHVESSSQGTVLLDKLTGASKFAYTWEGSAEGTLVVNCRNRWVWKMFKDPSFINVTIEGTYPLTADPKGKPFRPRLILREDHYDFGFINSGVTVERRQEGSTFRKAFKNAEPSSEAFFFAATRIPLPASGLTLSGSKQRKVLTDPDWMPMYDGKQRRAQYDSVLTWHLEPVYDDIEFVVDPQGYDTWRPEAGMNESTIGNEIKVEARLQSRDGGEAKVKARRIIFELSNGSREPGVALNFPIAGAGTDFDMQFSHSRNPPSQFIISGAGNQRLETLPGEYARASAVVCSYDWGGWSQLKVTAHLQDGRVISGHLKGRREVIQVPLPKRARDSRIADIWRQQAGTALPDRDDSETGPSGDSSPGDGFSLYEEYRGFYVAGRHVSGKPKTIDFFVRNYIGGDALAGIDLFANLTGAEVHATLLDNEFDRQRRVMNVNYGKGPHLVDQHGVFLETQTTLKGGLTVLSKADVRGRPVVIQSVNMQPRDSLTSLVTSENLPMSDLAFCYDRAVAHELLHCVGAEHHGKGDGQMSLHFVFGDDPLNPTGKSHFRYSPISETVKIIDETTGQDRASLMEGHMMMAREFWRFIAYDMILARERADRAARQGYRFEWTVEQLAEHTLNMYVAGFHEPTWYVGAPHGECSGEEMCIMRYYFGRLYPKTGAAHTFYYISEPRSERAGFGLCRSAAGTGVNDPRREPQPRYGDAARTRGGCAASIIFNDALPLQSDAIPKEAKE